MIAFNLSTATLKRREAESIPSHKIRDGKKALYDPAEVAEWIKDYNAIETSLGSTAHR